MLIGGLIILVKGSEVFIDSASEIAKRIGISEMLIGLTLVAFGTSLPEWISSLIAAFRDPDELPCTSAAESVCSVTDLALGNVIGSNIANIGMVLGLVGVIIAKPIIARPQFLLRDIPMMLILAILSWYFAIVGNQINRWEGLLMFILFLIVTFFTITEARNVDSSEENSEEESADSSEERSLEASKVSNGRLTLGTMLGFVGLIVGSQLLVDGASGIAIGIGIPESTVGITMVAFGTSVPELATSIMAGKRERFDMLLGGIIGSNIANTAVVLGTVALLVPVSVPHSMILFQFPVMLLFSLLLWVFMLDGKIQRWQSALLFGGYICFSGYLFLQ